MKDFVLKLDSLGRRSQVDSRTSSAMKAALILLTSCLVISVGVIAWLLQESSEEKGDVFIAVRVADRGAGQPDEEYYGEIEKRALLDLRHADTATRFIRLTNAYWLINGKQVPISEANANGIKYGYANTVYLRLASVYRIIELQPLVQQPHQ